MWWIQSHTCINGAIPTKWVVLQHLLRKDTPEGTEVTGGWIIPNIIKFSLYNIQVYSISKTYRLWHSMDHWQTPILIASIVDTVVFDHIFNGVNTRVGSQIHLPFLICLNYPISYVICAYYLPEHRHCFLYIKGIDYNEVTGGSRLKWYMHYIVPFFDDKLTLFYIIIHHSLL